MAGSETEQFLLNIDAKVNIFAWSYLGRRNISFREYLTDMAKSNYFKAEAILGVLDRLADASHEEQIALKDELYQNLGIQRRYIHPERTAGQKIFAAACNKINIKPIIIPDNLGTEHIHQFNAAHTISPHFNPEATLYCTRLFDDIPTNYHRAGIYTSCDLNETVTLHAPDDINVESVPRGDKTQHGKMQRREVPKHAIRGKVNTWIPLTTFTMDDLIRKQNVKAEFQYKLGYSIKAKQYYIMPLEAAPNNIYYVSYTIRTTDKRTISYKADAQFNQNETACLEALAAFQFGDRRKEENLKTLFAPLPTERKLTVIQYHLQQFKDENISESFATLTLPAINVFMKERKGVCAHLALIGFLIASMLGLESRYIRNGLHAFCEIENFSLCMGGGNRGKVIERKPMHEVPFHLHTLAIPKLSKLATFSTITTHAGSAESALDTISIRHLPFALMHQLYDPNRFNRHRPILSLSKDYLSIPNHRITNGGNNNGN